MSTSCDRPRDALERDSGHRVVVTGACGMLGSYVLRELCKRPAFEPIGLCFTKSDVPLRGVNVPLHKCDLSDETELNKILLSLHPDFIIHCAAERRPDVCEKAPENTFKVNVTSTEQIGLYAAKSGCFVIFLSSDYVFDGTKPPYSPNSTPNPLNAYGTQKVQAERALRQSKADMGVLRIPQLYGDMNAFPENIIAVFADMLRHPEKPVVLDNLAIRFPTYAGDVAATLVNLLERKLKHCGLHGTWHWSNDEPRTKYQMALDVAKALNAPHDHLVAGELHSDIPRPINAQLSTSAIDFMRVGKKTPLSEGLAICLGLKEDPSESCHENAK